MPKRACGEDERGLSLANKRRRDITQALQENHPAKLNRRNVQAHQSSHITFHVAYSHAHFDPSRLRGIRLRHGMAPPHRVCEWGGDPPAGWPAQGLVTASRLRRNRRLRRWRDEAHTRIRKRGSVPNLSE